MGKGSKKGSGSQPKPKAVVIARPTKDYEREIKNRDYVGSKEERDAIREAEMEERRKQREIGENVDLGSAADEWAKAAGLAAVGKAPPPVKASKGKGGKGSKGRSYEKHNQSWETYSSTASSQKYAPRQPSVPESWRVQAGHGGNDPWQEGHDPWADMSEVSDHPARQDNGAPPASANANWDDSHKSSHHGATGSKDYSKGYSNGGGIRSGLDQDERSRRAELRRQEAEERRRAREGANGDATSTNAVQEEPQAAQQNETGPDWRIRSALDYMFFKHHRGEWDMAKQVLCHAVEEQLSIPEVDVQMLTVEDLDEAFSAFKRQVYCLDFLRTGGPQSKSTPEQRLELLKEAVRRQMPLGQVGVISTFDAENAWSQFQRSVQQQKQHNGNGVGLYQ